MDVKMQDLSHPSHHSHSGGSAPTRHWQMFSGKSSHKRWRMKPIRNGSENKSRRSKEFGGSPHLQASCSRTPWE